MILPLVPQRQLLSNWCWSAVTSSISFYYNGNQAGYRQGDLAALILGNTCSGITPENAGQAPPNCNQQYDIAWSLYKVGNYAGVVDAPVSTDQIVQQINAGLPICCQINWQNANTNHFVILFGYESNMLIIGDPDPGNGGVFHVPYNQFVTNYRGGQWQRTIATRPAPRN